MKRAFAVLVLAGCGDDDSSAAADSDPAAVIAAYEAAFNAHDLDEVVAVFATDAVISVDLTRYPFREYYDLDWVVVEDPSGLSEVEATHPRTWVLYTFPVRLAATYPDLWNKLQEEYRTATVIPGTVGGGDIVIMVKP